MQYLFSIILVLLSTINFGQKDQFDQTWYNDEKTSKIRIFKATDGKYYGKIVWLKEPNDNNGSPRTDINNPDNNKKKQPLMELIILSGFSPSGNKEVFEGGKVYDPTNGKTYCGRLTLKGKTLDLRGFICSMSLLGRTSQWTLAE